MDQQTLKYMGERVDKARKIIKKIEELTVQAKRVDGAESIRFDDLRGNHKCTIYSDDRSEKLDSRILVKELRTLTIEAINKEIRRLEQELAKL
ncbi:hypothetical protein D3C78_1533180 [compost metagenome]